MNVCSELDPMLSKLEDTKERKNTPEKEVFAFKQGMLLNTG